MLSRRAGTKKLIIAFHFQYSAGAAWKCGACRAGGLDIRRRCGWGGYKESPQPVWARGQHALHRCPKPWITAESLALLEEFLIRKLTGANEYRELPAKVVDAIATLEREWVRENRNGAD